MIATKPKPNNWIENAMKKSRALKMIIRARTKLGLSTYQASERAGIAQSMWFRVEAEQREASWDILLKMAKAVELETSVSIRHKE